MLNFSTFCPLFGAVWSQWLPALQDRDRGSVLFHGNPCGCCEQWGTETASGVFYHLTTFFIVPFTIWPHSSLCLLPFDHILHCVFYHLTTFFIVSFTIWPHSSLCLLPFDHILHCAFYHLTTFFIVPFTIWPHSLMCLLSFYHILHCAFYHVTIFVIVPWSLICNGRAITNRNAKTQCRSAQKIFPCRSCVCFQICCINIISDIHWLR